MRQKYKSFCFYWLLVLQLILQDLHQVDIYFRTELHSTCPLHHNENIYNSLAEKRNGTALPMVHRPVSPNAYRLLLSALYEHAYK